MYLFIKVFFLSIIAIQSFAQEYINPIHSTNQYINQLIFYRPYTQSATQKENSSINIDISQSNIYQNSEILEADFELTTLDFTYYHRYSDKLELSFNFPFYYISKGFLDSPLDFVHTSLGIITTREHEGHINYQLNYKVADQIYKQSSYFALGNPQIELKLYLYSKNNLLISANCGVKIPLGKVEDGFTTEKFDFMGGIQMQKDYQKISWLLNVAATLNGKREISEDIDSSRVRYFVSSSNKFALSSIIPFDYKLDSDFLFTYQYSSPPYEGSDEKFSSYTHLLQFAIRNDLNNNSYVDVFFNQNTIPRHNEADVTFGLSYNYKGFSS